MDETKTPAPQPDKTADSKPTAPSIPPFLTREEYEQIGDDPEPLPEGFEVIEGASGQTASAPDTAPEAVSPAPVAAPAESSEEDDGEDGIRAVGAFFSEGVGAVRAVGAAKKAHDTARDELEALEAEIAERKAELAHRRNVEQNFDAIIADKTAALTSATEAVKQAVARQGELNGQIEQLKEKLQAMKDEDAQTEKRLKAAADAAGAKEDSARESGARLQRRLDDVKRNLKRAEEERFSGVEAAKRAIESAEARLTTLNDEYAELQRNPSANTAEYSVRSGELQREIAQATEELTQAKSALPNVQAEVEQNLATAQKMVAEAEKPIAAAKEQFQTVSAEADKARDELDTAKQDARDRQRTLRDQISDQEKALKAEKQTAEDNQAAADAAQAAIDEANAIHAHPEVTEQLAQRLADDERVRADKSTQVETLAAAEQEVRERTRGSRVKFIAAVAAVAVVVVVAIILWFALS